MTDLYRERSEKWISRSLSSELAPTPNSSYAIRATFLCTHLVYSSRCVAGGGWKVEQIYLLILFPCSPLLGVPLFQLVEQVPQHVIVLVHHGYHLLK